jgi:putative transposase
MARELVLDAILMAVRQRKPWFIQITGRNVVAMRGDASVMRIIVSPVWAGVETAGITLWLNRFFSSVKQERIKKRIYTTREMANAEIDEYSEMFYNCTRRHSHRSGVSPEAFEAVSKRA